jgi:CBS domain-containing protein
MKVREIMTKNPACCTPDSSLREIAQMMVEHDCGCIPVVDNNSTMKPVGTITDRDITVRAFTGSGQNPLEMKASDVMTSDIVSVRPGTSIEQCCDVMENKQIRRVLVVDESGRLSGIVAQADVAEFNTPRSGELVREISEADGSDDVRRFSKQQRNFSTGYNQQQRQFSTRYNQQNRRNEQHLRGGHRQQNSGGKAAFLTGTILPLLVGVGAVMAISSYLNQQEDSSRLVSRRRTSSTPLNPGTTDDKISSDFLAPSPAISTRTTESTSTGVTSSSNQDDDTGNSMSYGTAGGRR